MPEAPNPAVNDPACMVAAPVLLCVEDVARLLNCSARHVYRLSDMGRIPKPVKLGALARWPRAQMLEWIASGCPKPPRK